jgi:solute carrier family 32 (vesicular inhibitory amino acid transporter)
MLHIFVPILFMYFECFFILMYDLCDSEALDPLTIAAAPNIGSVLRAPSVIYASLAAGRSSKSYLELQDGFLTGSQIQESTWWEKASIQKNIPEELPIGYGCTFTQTIFNGKLSS